MTLIITDDINVSFYEVDLENSCKFTNCMFGNIKLI